VKEVVIGSDFGAPASAGQQAKKIILIEAIRVSERCYIIQPIGRNERLVREVPEGASWSANRRGWTVHELTESLASDKQVSVVALDFPFSIPISLLNDSEFAGRLEQKQAFGSRSAWAKFVRDRLDLRFPSTQANSRLGDLAKFDAWRDKEYWKHLRQTDRATGGSAPLKHQYQNVFAMTLIGSAMLEELRESGFVLNLTSAAMTPNMRIVFETYPAAVARSIGFRGSYKTHARDCMKQAEKYLEAQGITLQMDPQVEEFCHTYVTGSQPKDPDGADAFLCLTAAICFREGLAELHCGDAQIAALNEEGCIIAPRKVAAAS
jgi:hypothetical protein